MQIISCSSLCCNVKRSSENMRFLLRSAYSGSILRYVSVCTVLYLHLFVHSLRIFLYTDSNKLVTTSTEREAFRCFISMPGVFLNVEVHTIVAVWNETRSLGFMMFHQGREDTRLKEFPGNGGTKFCFQSRLLLPWERGKPRKGEASAAVALVEVSLTSGLYRQVPSFAGFPFHDTGKFSLMLAIIRVLEYPLHETCDGLIN